MPNILVSIMKSFKFGFTLAEVLITLGIIGIVAALTIPTLITKHKKKVVGTRLKSTYSQLSQAIQMAQAEYGDMSNWSEADVAGIVLDTNISDTRLVQVFADKYVIPYLKITSSPETTTLKNKGYKNGILYKNNSQYVTSNYQYYFAELTNGVILLFTNTGNGTTNTITNFIIWVDIDGFGGENKLGHDIFPFNFTTQKGVFVYDMEKDENVLINTCKDGGKNTIGACLALIIKNGWEINDKYPW